MLTYSDIAARVDAGETAEQIAAALSQDPRTRSDIEIARLMGELAIPTGLAAKVEAMKDTSQAARQLYDLINERRIVYIRTATNPQTAVNIATGFAGLLADGVLDGLPLTPEQIRGAFYSLGGGLRFRQPDGSPYTAEDVQAVIDAHEREQAVAAIGELFQAAGLAATRERLKPGVSDQQAIAAGLAVIEGA